LKHLHSRLAVIILVLFAGLLQTGCKENVLINSKIAPTINVLGVLDTFLPCITHTYYDDSAVTSVNIGGIPIYQGVGAFTDPFFGTMTGATYFQVVPQDNSPAVFDGQTIDSAVLILPYSGFTDGDTGNQSLTQTYQAFYLNDPLSLDSTYYSFTSKAIDATYPLSDPTTINIHHLRDSFLLNVFAVNTPALRIKLKLPTLMSHIQPAQSGLVNSSSPFTDFINAFNGLCVRVSDSRQTTTAIPYFRLDGADIYSEAGIVVYYHPTGGSVDSSFVQSYHFDRSYCAHYNNITRSYRQYPVNNLFSSKLGNEQIIALQNLPGATIDIVIPGLTKLPKGIINKAELQLALLPTIPYNPTTILPPEALYPIGVGNGTYPAQINNGLTYNLADYYPLTSTSPLSILDGTVHKMIRGGNTLVDVFTINIPREVMASIKANNDTIHLHINGSQDFYGAFHMVAGGGAYADTNYRPKLFVVYSKLN
jgi:hypothetical protein